MKRAAEREEKSTGQQSNVVLYYGLEKIKTTNWARIERLTLLLQNPKVFPKKQKPVTKGHANAINNHIMRDTGTCVPGCIESCAFVFECITQHPQTHNTTRLELIDWKQRTPHVTGM